MQKTKIDNAIILAAGFSSRFVPICFDKPKGLLTVNGDTLIERQIHQLHNVGINDITVITGAYADQFDFLKEKYGVRLIFNPDFAAKNNFASIYAAREILKNTIITSSDLYFKNNIFQGTAEHSYYASVFIEGETNQRVLTLDKNNKIIATTYGGKNTWITFGGQAFFTEDFSKKLINYIQPVYHKPEYANKYWVDFQDEHLDELPMYIKRVSVSDIAEFNTLEALWLFDTDFNGCSISPTLKTICNKLNVKNERELSNIKPIMSGNSAIGCTFIVNKNKYEYIYISKSLKDIPNE